MPLEPFPGDPPAPSPAEPTAYRPLPPAKRRRLILPIVLAAVLVLAAGGAAAYRFVYHKPPSAVRRAAETTTPPPAAQPAPSSSTAAGDATQYTSNGQDLNLSFAYPSDWTAAPPSGGNTGDQPITVTSPLRSLTNSAGRTVTGKVVVSIRPGTAQISELASGAAAVAQDSVQFAYGKPTASQHQYPYATFVRLAGGSDAANGFDEVFVTGITKFTKGQNISAESLGQLDPIISARFYTCTAGCTGANAAALAITPATWQNDATFVQVQALFESLQLH